MQRSMTKVKNNGKVFIKYLTVQPAQSITER